jgi:hypothetical protein
LAADTVERWPLLIAYLPTGPARSSIRRSGRNILSSSPEHPAIRSCSPSDPVVSSGRQYWRHQVLLRRRDEASSLSSPRFNGTSAGEFYLPAADTLEFVRQSEDDALTARKPLLKNPPAADRISNDGYYRNASALAGVPIYIRPDPVNGSARMQMQIALNPAEVRPHFPYTGPDHSGPVPSVGGYLNIVDDLIDPASSVLLLGESMTWARACGIRIAAGVAGSIGDALYSAASLRLGSRPTADYWPSRRAAAEPYFWLHRHAESIRPPHQRRGSGRVSHARNFPARRRAAGSRRFVRRLLFTGFGDVDLNYVERPETSAYDDGFANYAGLNFRGQRRARASSRVGTPARILARNEILRAFGGVSGLHQASSFPSSLRLSGLRHDVHALRLSFLDSDNWESRTDGRITFPAQPSGFFVDFRR